jgi:hypothetical protein
MPSLSSSSELTKRSIGLERNQTEHLLFLVVSLMVVVCYELAVTFLKLFNRPQG